MAGFRSLRRVPSLKSRVARKKQGIKTTDYNIKGKKTTKDIKVEEDPLEGEKVKG